MTSVDLPPALSCVPAALGIITGLPMDAAVFPALNRAERADDLLGEVAGGVLMATAERALRDLGYTVRRYRRDGSERLTVAAWGVRSTRYAPYPILIATRTHALVARAGRVYDNHDPRGAEPDAHPFRYRHVTYAAIVQGG